GRERQDTLSRGVVVASLARVVSRTSGAALRWALAALLAAASANHLARGCYFLVVQEPPRAIADLRNRRTETAYFLDRVSPLSQQMLAADPSGAGGWAAGAGPRWSHGAEHARGALPPWTYPPQLLIVPPVRAPAALP